MSRVKKVSGYRIRLAREDKNLTQEQAAKLVGVNPTSWQNWESERKTPRPHRLKSIADALGVPMGWITGQDSPSRDVVKSWDALVGKFVAIVTDFMKIPLLTFPGEGEFSLTSVSLTNPALVHVLGVERHGIWVQLHDDLLEVRQGTLEEREILQFFIGFDSILSAGIRCGRVPEEFRPLAKASPDHRAQSALCLTVPGPPDVEQSSSGFLDSS